MFSGLYKVTGIRETLRKGESHNGYSGGTWMCDLELLPDQPIFWEHPPPPPQMECEYLHCLLNTSAVKTYTLTNTRSKHLFIPKEDRVIGFEF